MGKGKILDTGNQRGGGGDRIVPVVDWACGGSGRRRQCRTVRSLCSLHWREHWGATLLQMHMAADGKR